MSNNADSEAGEVRAKLIFVVSHRRSGTHWTIDAIRSNCRGVAARFAELNVLTGASEREAILGQLRKRCSAEPRTHLIVKAHMTAHLAPFDQADRSWIANLLKASKVIYVYRDGRDTLVSLYYYMKRRNLEFPDIHEFIRMNNDYDPFNGSVNRVQYWRTHVRDWIARDDLDMISIAYEDLYLNYHNTVRKLSRFLGLSLRHDKPRPIDLEHYGAPRRLLRKILPRTARSSAVAPRKGVVGDWRNCFSQDDLAWFDSIAGDLMRQLGYYE